MKKTIAILALLIIGVNFSFAQKYLCRDGHIWFFSSTPMEDIEAHNNQASGIIDTESGDVLVTVLMKSFEFEKALMQEHFNENYVESDKFPKGKFKGKITNLSEVEFGKNGTYSASVSGTLTIHGVAKEVETQMTIEVNGEELSVKGKFITSPSDFDIDIPSVVQKNIAKEIDVNIDMKFKPYKKK